MRTLAGYALAGYWVALFVATHVPLPPKTFAHGTDKSAHFLAYAGLTLLMGTWMCVRRPEQSRGRRYAVIVGVLSLYAVLDELLQIPVGRSAELYDAIADWIGIAFGIVCIAVAERISLVGADRRSGDEGMCGDETFQRGSTGSQVTNPAAPSPKSPQ